MKKFLKYNIIVVCTLLLTMLNFVSAVAISIKTEDIHGKCIEIRDWEQTDAQDLAKILNNTKLTDNLNDMIPVPYTIKDAQYFINASLDAPKDKEFSFAITYDGQLVGNVGIFRKDGLHLRTAEIGYYIGEDFWGHGIATEAIKLACKYVFDNTDIVRIFALPFSYNTGSCRVLEKAGFEYECLLRNNAVKKGKVIDTKLYAILKDVKTK